MFKRKSAACTRISWRRSPGEQTVREPRKRQPSRVASRRVVGCQSGNVGMGASVSMFWFTLSVRSLPPRGGQVGAHPRADRLRPCPFDPPRETQSSPRTRRSPRSFWWAAGSSRVASVNDPRSAAQRPKKRQGFGIHRQGRDFFSVISAFSAISVLNRPSLNHTLGRTA
jgi:hypothetical protein